MTLSLVVALSALAVPADAEKYAVVVVPARSIAMPIVVRVDFAQVARALGMRTEGLKVLPQDVRAALDQGEGKLEPVACQYDSDGLASGELTLGVPPADVATRVRVYFTSEGPRWEDAAVTGAVKVTREGGAFVVDNGSVRVCHDPAKQAGLPSRWEFVKTGKIFEQFNNNDRVYNETLGSQSLRNCPDPKVGVVVEGPLRTVVRVSAYYADAGGQQPDSRPRAVYEYSYFAGSPYILVRGHMEQEEAFPWDELHFIEINFPGTDFTHWASSDGRGELKADRQSILGRGWAALLNGPEGPAVLGLVDEGARVYDGRGEYGTYLHGPWVRWDTTERNFEVALYASDAPGGLSDLAEAGASMPRPGEAYVSTEELNAALEALSSAGTGSQRRRWAWIASLVQRLAREDLLQGVETARDALKLARDGHEAQAWFAANKSFLCAERGDLGMAWRRNDDGRVILASLFDLRAKRELLGKGEGALWVVKAEDKNGKEVVMNAALPAAGAWLDANARRVRIEWKPLRHMPGVVDAKDSLTVQVVARISEAGALEMEMNIDNTSELSLAEVAWPQMYFGALGNQAQDDVFLAAISSGKVWKNPYQTGAKVSGLYPNGWTDLQMMALYDRRGGCVLMAQDLLASTKNIEAAPEGQSMKMGFSWPAPDHTVPGNDFNPPGRIAVVPFEGDWYDAAMIYRAWVEREAQWWPQRGLPGRPDTPEWMRDLPLWVTTGGGPENVVPAVKAFREYMGVPCAIHWYNWHEIPFDDNYPHYFPAKPGFAEGVKALQEAGVRVMPYINGRLWDSDTEDFPTVALPWATKDRKGEYYIETYGSGQKLVPMCPVSKLWQETVQGIVKRLVGPEYNVDGVYIDQVAAASPRLCYDERHGHPFSGGHWWTTEGYWPMLEKLQADLAAEFPDKMLTTECTAEPFTHVFDGYLSWHWQETNAVPLFPAVYGDKVRLFSRAYNFAGDKALVFRMKMAQQFVFGEQIGWLDPGVYKDEKIGPYLRRLAKIRWQLRDYFRGRMVRPPIVAGAVDDVTGDWAWGGSRIVTLKAVQAGAFQSETGEVALVITNLSDKPQKFELRVPLVEYGLADNTSFVRIGENGVVDQGLEVIDDEGLEMELGPMEAFGLKLAMG